MKPKGPHSHTTDHSYQSEISAHKQEAIRLAIDNARYATIIEGLADGYYEVDLAGNFTFFNEAMRNMLGYSRAELTGMNNRLFMNPETARKVYAVFNQVYRTGMNDRAFDWELICRDGSTRWVETSISLMRDVSNRPTGFFGIARDITEAKAASAALRKSEARYLSLLDASPDAIVMYDMNGCVAYINPAFEKTFRWCKKELLGKRIDFVPEDCREQTRAVLERVLDGQSIQMFETRRLTSDGSVLDIQLSASMFYDTEGYPHGLVVILRDVSEFKKSQRALSESERNFQTLVEEAPYGVSIIDQTGRYKYLNPKFVEMFGYCLEEIPSGRHWFRQAFPDADYRRKVIATWVQDHRYFYPGESRTYQFQVTCKSGTKRTIAFKPVTLMSGDVFVCHEDVTEREAVKEALRNAFVEAVHTDSVRRRVINHLSHELRTPLAILRAVLKLIRKKCRKAKVEGVEAILERGARAVDRLKDITGKVEDIAKMPSQEKTDGGCAGHEVGNREAGVTPWVSLGPDSAKLTDETENSGVMLEKFIPKLVDSVRPIFAHRRINIQISLQPGLCVRLEEAVLEKVLLGFVKNAIENTPDQGKIELLSTMENGRVVVKVRDHGIGIQKEDQDQIFGGFYHTQKTDFYSTRRPYEFNCGGTGLDLLRIQYLARRSNFLVGFSSRRCRFLVASGSACPGKIDDCGLIKRREECLASGGSLFYASFAPEVGYSVVNNPKPGRQLVAD